ncbi:MAG: uroporphyrinogen decarboxylase family protein [Clostridia bacterium]
MSSVMCYKDAIQKALNFLETQRYRIDRSVQAQCSLWEGSKPDQQPLLLSCALPPELEDLFPELDYREIRASSENMLVHGLVPALRAAAGGRESVPSVRANMGCGVFPTLLGVRQEVFTDKMPWVRKHAPREHLLGMDAGDIVLSEEFKQGLEHMAAMSVVLADSPCRIFPMDLQGPFDTAHIAYGDRIFYEIHDDPGFLHHLLELSCEAIILGMEACLEYMPGDMVPHYNSLVIPRSLGGIKISEDTSTLLSREQIQEFVVPYTQRILEHFGGGYIHYCGKNPGLMEEILHLPQVRGLNLGNPEMHDMEDVLGRCRDRGLLYYGWIPRKENEGHHAFFQRCLQASCKNGLCRILLQVQGGWEERQDIAEAWEGSVMACG